MTATIDREQVDRGDFSGVNRSEMSRQLGMDVAHVSRVLTGKRNPSIHTAAKMAEYLGLPLDKFYALITAVKVGG
jgi:transcriptional regulator with XRE-family HTH domain